jgi:hypothetical protein
LNEPVSAGIVDVVDVGVDAVLQPAKTRARAIISARGKRYFFTDLFKLFSPYYIQSYLLSLIVSGGV